MSRKSDGAHRGMAVWPLAFVAQLAGVAPALPQPDAPPTEPILRLNTTAHIAPIYAIATDRENRYVVTASYDKTARVWSLPDGRLLTVLRVPIDEGNVGQLRAVAVTPDGNTVALGGSTGMSDTQNVYLFDRASGALRRRLSGLLSGVTHLAYSSDGRRLAATLRGPNGIRVYDVERGYDPLPSDPGYGDVSYWADFDRQGRLVTTSSDGFIRLYAADHYDAPIAKVTRPGGKEPFSAAFSPDGQRVAVGYHESKKVDVLSAQDLTLLQAPNTTGIVEDLATTGWSADGRDLFAGGQAIGFRVRRWENGGSGRHTDIHAANNTITQLLPLKNRGMLFAAADPAFGIIDARGRAKILQGPGQLDFRNRLNTLAVSKDGKTVEQGTDHPRRLLRFTLTERRLDIDLPADGILSTPITEAPELSVKGWYDSYHPSLKGQPLTLDHHERSRSLALSPSLDGFVLGTESSVRRYARTGKPIWRKLAPSVVWGVNITPDGRLIVSTHADGTIRWWRDSDGQEILAVFVHTDGKRWIAWTPQGYYDASVGADELIGWHINHGFDQAPDFFPVSQFRDRFYRPDVIANVLDTLNVDEAVRRADAAAGGTTLKAAPVTTLLPPVVTIVDPPQEATMTETELKVIYSVRTPSGDPVTRVEAQVDGRKVGGEDQEMLGTGDMRIGLVTIKQLPRRNATISIIAYNKNGASEPAAVQTTWGGQGTQPKPTLYVLAIGVSKYQDETLDLRYPTKDADDFVKTVKGHSMGLYEEVIVAPSPAEGKWTHDAVLDGLDWIEKQPTNKDVAMIFISGHAVVTADQIYRFLPYDYDEHRKERTTVRSVDFQDFLSKAGGKVIVFLDTCFSGGVLRGSKAPLLVTEDKFANELAAAEVGTVVFASSTGNQFSREDPAWGNGAFTKAVVEGLGGKADRRNEGVVRVHALADYVYDRVKDITGGDQKPLVAIPKFVENMPIAVVLH
jgi:WD40 repeat protein